MPSYEDLKALQNESLERKILISQARIIEWYLRYKAQVYVSFSGGKDSTVLLHMVRNMFPEVEAVFVSTGLEYPEIEKFIRTFDNVTILKPDMKFKDVISEYGYPVIGKEVSEAVWGARQGYESMKHKFDKDRKFNVNKYSYLLDAPFKISHKCCNVMKKKPAKDFEKRSGKKAIIGTMTEESQLRQTAWMKSGCNSFDGKREVSMPMSFWTEQDVLHYLQRFEIPYCSVYGEILNKSEFAGQLSIDEIPTDLMMSKCDRTGCMFCLFGINHDTEPNRMQRMKLTHPKQYDYCIREENGLGIGKVLDFINVKY